MEIIMTSIIEDLKNRLLNKRIYIFIDAANLERSVKDMYVDPRDIPEEFKSLTSDKLCWRVDYKKLKIFFENFSELKKILFYSAELDSDSHHNFRYFLDKNGYKVKTKPLKEYLDHTEEKPHRKANFDVEIAVDAVSKMQKFDTFILFSGDCDFEYLLKFLRGANRQCITFSRSGHVSKELPPASNKYFDIVDFRFYILKICNINNNKNNVNNKVCNNDTQFSKKQKS